VRLLADEASGNPVSSRTSTGFPRNGISTGPAPTFLTRSSRPTPTSPLSNPPAGAGVRDLGFRPGDVDQVDTVQVTNRLEQLAFFPPHGPERQRRCDIAPVYWTTTYFRTDARRNAPDRRVYPRKDASADRILHSGGRLDVVVGRPRNSPGGTGVLIPSRRTAPGLLQPGMKTRRGANGHEDQRFLDSKL